MVAEKCREIEQLQRKNNHFAVYRKIKEVTRKKMKYKTYTLIDNNHKNITDPEDLKKHWKSYIEELFKSVEPHQFDITRKLKKSPGVLKESVIKAIRNCKSGKSPGSDEIHIEVVIPHEWLKIVFIPILKNTSAKKCDQYRLISLMSHLLKIFFKIIYSRIYRKCVFFISYPLWIRYQKHKGPWSGRC